jgi:hypothetical protein
MLAVSFTGYDPGSVKTPQAPKPGKWLSQIAQNWPCSEIVIALIAIQGEICSNNFLRRRLLHSQDPQPTSPELSLDHLVSHREQLKRYFEVERLGRLEIDGQFQFGRLKDGNVVWFRTFQYPADHLAGALAEGREVGP